jgi:GTP-binding protein
VVIEADERLRTLLDLRPARLVRAPAGQPGGPKQMSGARGEDRIVSVPVGTVIIDVGQDRVLADLTAHGQQCMAAKGGRGGRGNLRFTTPTNRAPRRAESGEAGEQRDVRLELRLMADVGLLGFPNAGKSTFMRRVSRARPRVADYPFTTLVPNLGVCALSDHRSFVIADLPGLVEGAARGAGLGHRFLRHLARTRALVHLLDPTDPDRSSARQAYLALQRELAAHDPHLAELPQVVAVNKIDLPQAAEKLPEIEKDFEKMGIPVHAVSGATGQGVLALLEQLWQILGVLGDEASPSPRCPDSEPGAEEADPK